jgi:hypothetical protein
VEELDKKQSIINGIKGMIYAEQHRINRNVQKNSANELERVLLENDTLFEAVEVLYKLALYSFAQADLLQGIVGNVATLYKNQEYEEVAKNLEFVCREMGIDTIDPKELN